MAVSIQVFNQNKVDSLCVSLSVTVGFDLNLLGFEPHGGIKSSHLNSVCPKSIPQVFIDFLSRVKFKISFFNTHFKTLLSHVFH